MATPKFVSAIEYPFAEVVAACEKLANRFSGQTLINEQRQVILSALGKAQYAALKDLLVTTVQAALALSEVEPPPAPTEPAGWQTPPGIKVVTPYKTESK